MWRYLNAAKVATRDVDVDTPTELFVERFCAIDIGNREQHDFELHVDGSSFCCHNSSSIFKSYLSGTIETRRESRQLRIAVVPRPRSARLSGVGCSESVSDTLSLPNSAALHGCHRERR